MADIKHRDYWLNKLSGNLVKSTFPYTSQKTVGNDDPERFTFRFTGPLYDQLMKLSNHSDLRLHMILVAGLTLLVNKYSYEGNRDILLGSPIYKQEIQGEFINMVLPLRNQIQEQQTFKDFLLQVRQTVIQAVEHQNYPLETLLYKLNMPVSTGGFPLFDIMVLLENIHDREYIEHIKVNMIFCFCREDGCIKGMVEYIPSRYDQALVRQIVRHLEILLETVLWEVDSRLDEVEILAESEKKQLLLDFNHPWGTAGESVEYSQYPTIHQWFARQVEQTPGHTALVFEDRHLTYRELNYRANRLARWLIHQGIAYQMGKDMVVGVMIDRCLEMVIGILAVLKTGAAYLPLDVNYPQERILFMLRDSRASFLLTREKVIGRFSISSLTQGDIEVETMKTMVTVTPTREQIKDFDGLPHPDRTLVPYEKYHQYIGIAMAKHTVSLQATRGCPYNCAFCHKIWPKKHVVRSAGNIFEEILDCYRAGARRFSFIDDVFNLDAKNSSRLLELIIKQGLDIQLFFPNGLRGDILGKELIDLMIEAGTVNMDLALESASPRIQKLIKKNLDLEKFQEILQYITSRYPHLLLEIELILGFPTETEEEALQTLEFVERWKWIHFPNLNVLKIYPNTDMSRLAVEKGISREAIQTSVNLGYHQIPETLPFAKGFVRQQQSRFMKEYFLSKERLLHVLPLQMGTLTEEELVQKYDSYLPAAITCFDDILHLSGISREELGDAELLQENSMAAPDFREKMRSYFPPQPRQRGALRVLLLDLSLLFTAHSRDMLYDMIEEPLGLMYLLTYLDKTFKDQVRGKIAKSRIDFDNYEELKTLILEFKPDVIGIRTLSYYKDFFHTAVLSIRQWGCEVPIVAGGPYATSDYEVVLQDTHVDVVVLGEGEITFAHLLEEIMKNAKKLPGEEVLQQIPGIAFIKKQDKARLNQVNRKMIILERIAAELQSYPGEDPGIMNQPQDLLYVIYTSGSTGGPKGTMLEHRNLVNLLHHQYRFTNIDLRRVLQFATICFDVSAQEIFSTLLNPQGGTLFLISNDTQHDVRRLFEVIRRKHIDTLFLPASFLKFIFSEKNYVRILPRGVTHIVSAGEQLKVNDEFRRYLQENGIYLHNHYGPSETHVVTCLTLDPGKDIPGLPSIGKPVVNTGIYILNRQMGLQPVEVPGELTIGGFQVGRGYWEQEQMTARQFIANPFKNGDRLYLTGDMARWMTNGNLEFLGRIDFQVKIRGFRVELEEIEKQLLKYPGIKEAVVVPNEQPDGDRYLTAFFVSGAETEEDDLRHYLTLELPDYMVPAYFLHLDEIPLTPNKKIDRSALLEIEAGHKSRGSTYTPPGNELEKKLVKIWTEVLKVERVGIHNDFFSLGGHSLKVLKLLNAYEKELATKINFQDIFTHPTIADQCQLVAAKEKNPLLEIRRQPQRTYYGLSYSQKRLWVIYTLDPQNPAFNFGGSTVLYEPVDETIIKKIIRMLIRRHENFRTYFMELDGEPVQVVEDIDRVNLETVDLSHLNGEKQEAALRDCHWKEKITPFCLEQAPLFRIKLVKLHHRHYELIFNMHHILTDGWSMEVLESEFLLMYGALKKGEKISLPPLRIQFRDYAAWQDKLLADEGGMREAREFWANQLIGELPVLDLPYDYPRSRIQENKESAAYRVVVPETIVNRLRDLAGSQKASLFMLLLAAFEILLWQITGQQDIILAVPAAARQHEDLKNVIGFFVNTLIVRNHISPGTPFTGFLEKIQANTLQVLQYQSYPLELICDELKIKYPEIPIFFNMSIFGEMDKVVLKDREAYHTPQVQNTKFAVVCYIKEYKNSIVINPHYYKGLFKPNTIEKIMQKYVKILEDIGRDPGQPLKSHVGASKKKRIQLDE
jgi:amino acid adenylation domain-containing protein